MVLFSLCKLIDVKLTDKRSQARGEIWIERNPNKNPASLLLDHWQQKGLLNPDLLPSLLSDSLEDTLKAETGLQKPQSYFQARLFFIL